MEAINWLMDNIVLILTGFIISSISGLIFSTTKTGFKAWGRYQKKEIAISIFIIINLVIGVTTPVIESFLRVIFMRIFNALNIGFLGVIGSITFISLFILNYKIEKWKHTTRKSILIYLTSVGLILTDYFMI